MFASRPLEKRKAVDLVDLVDIGRRKYQPTNKGKYININALSITGQTTGITFEG